MFECRAVWPHTKIAINAWPARPFFAGATADQRIDYYLASAIMLKPNVTLEEMTETLGFAAVVVNAEREFGPQPISLRSGLAPKPLRLLTHRKTDRLVATSLPAGWNQAAAVGLVLT